MPLAKGAWTITAQVFLAVLSHVTVVPRDPHNCARLDMIDFSGIVRFHNIKLLIFAQPCQATDLRAVDQVCPRLVLTAVEQDGVGDRDKHCSGQ